jgi:5-methylcytosine-specific restriction endonuclease McrA
MFRQRHEANGDARADSEAVLVCRGESSHSRELAVAESVRVTTASRIGANPTREPHGLAEPTQTIRLPRHEAIYAVRGKPVPPDFKCQLRLPGCKAVADEVDHSVPREVGGVLYDEANLRASCGSCNRSQGNRAGTPLGSMAIDRRRFSTSSGVGSSATAHHAERAFAPLLARSTGGG